MTDIVDIPDQIGGAFEKEFLVFVKVNLEPLLDVTCVIPRFFYKYLSVAQVRKCLDIKDMTDAVLEFNLKKDRDAWLLKRKVMLGGAADQIVVNEGWGKAKKDLTTKRTQLSNLYKQYYDTFAKNDKPDPNAIQQGGVLVEQIVKITHEYFCEKST
jgi:hypothetical protein